MIQVEDILKEATASLEAALEGLKWEKEENGRWTHFTGRGPEWRVELVTLEHPVSGTGVDYTERMGSAIRGTVILKLTEDQCRAAEILARRTP